MGKNKFLKRNVGFLFILPWLIGFLVFKLYPFAASLYYSFTDYQLFEGITKYTMENYVDIFTTPKIVKALKVTFQYSFMTVPLKLVAALFIAYICVYFGKDGQFRPIQGRNMQSCLAHQSEQTHCL